MKLSLYKVSNDYLQACENLFEREEELSADVVNDTLEGLAGDVELKSLNVAAYYQNLKKEINAMKEYEKDMRDRRRVKENKNERLREYLKENMERCDIQKIAGPEFTISLRKSPDSVIIDSANDLHEDFILGVEIRADKTKIKQALQDGKPVEGAHLETNKTTLNIK